MTSHWFDGLRAVAPHLTAQDFVWQPMPQTQEREAAVLVLFSEGDRGGDVLLIERPGHMRSHAGQPAFPGGAMDEGETPTQTALREAHEEVGLDPTSVTVIAELPQLWLPPSRFKVTPVLAWWHAPHRLEAVNAHEVSAVHAVPIAEMVNPTNRVRVRTRSGFMGPAFTVRGMTVWGFTGGVLAQLFDLAGWSTPWDDSVVLERPEDIVPR
jgi:8-oxo-dGTP pyrophosphatase MutT (NUDIX family)